MKKEVTRRSAAGIIINSKPTQIIVLYWKSLCFLRKTRYCLNLSEFRQNSDRIQTMCQACRNDWFSWDFCMVQWKIWMIIRCAAEIIIVFKPTHIIVFYWKSLCFLPKTGYCLNLSWIQTEFKQNSDKVPGLLKLSILHWKSEGAHFKT